MLRMALGRGIDPIGMPLSAERSMMTAASWSSAASAPGYPLRTAWVTVEPSITMMREIRFKPREGDSTCGGLGGTSASPRRIMPSNSLTLSLSERRHIESPLAYSLR